MKKIKLDIVGLSNSQTQSGAYALVLGEVYGRRRLPIIIGAFEAQSIAIEIEKLTPTRPLTHDLFKSFAEAYHIQIQEVIIYNLVDGVFFAKLICNDETGGTHEIDARTSDAIALAVRFNAAIYTYEFILASAGIVIEGNDFAFLENMEANKDNPTEDLPSAIPVSGYQNLSLEDLQKKLEEALAEEAYEKAARIRDEMAKRK